MALFNRITRLFRADLHAVLDQIEEPEVIIKNALREMEEALVNTKHRIKLLTRDKQQLLLQREELEESLKTVEGKLQTCLDSDNDDLARNVIKQKLQYMNSLKTINAKGEQTSHKLEEQLNQLDDEQQRITMIQQKLSFIQNEKSSIDESSESLYSDVKDYSQIYSIQEEDIEVALLEEKNKRRTV